MVYKPRSERKRARGGKAETEPLTQEKGTLYNAKGSPAAAAIDAKSDGFRRGGRAKASGGEVEGMEARQHLGRRARGGRTGAPFSSGHDTKPPGNEKGSPGEQAPMIP